MKLNVYTIKDIKAETFGNPFYSANDNTAKRSLEQASKDPNTTISQYPEDFVLYKLGQWDDETATISTLDTPFYLSTGATQEEINS